MASLLLNHLRGGEHEHGTSYLVLPLLNHLRGGERRAITDA